MKKGQLVAVVQGGALRGAIVIEYLRIAGIISDNHTIVI